MPGMAPGMPTPNEKVMLRMAYAVLSEIANSSPSEYPGVTELAQAWCSMYRALRDRDASKTPAESPRSKSLTRRAVRSG